MTLPQYGPNLDPPPAKRRIWPFLLAVALAAGLLGMLVGVGIGSSGSTTTVQTVATPGPTVTQEVPVPGPTKTVTKPGPTKTVTAEPKDAPEPTEISDGSYIVGDDVKPGRYRTVEPAEDLGGLCYAEVTDGEEILRQEVTDKGKTIIDIPKGDGRVFTSSGCGSWERVKS